MVATFLRACVAIVLGSALLAAPSPSHASGPVPDSWDPKEKLPPLYLGPGDAEISHIDLQAVIRVSDFGLRYIAGKHDSRLTVTYVADHKILFSDTATRSLKQAPKRCRSQRAEVGIAVLCRIPPRFRDSMFVEIWPRLGDDYVDTSALPERFRSWVLGDAGEEEIYTGPGRDFVNGAQDDDIAYGGGGDDWIRTGIGDDVIYGEDGNDRLVGVDDNDYVHGGAGHDEVAGGRGNDELWGGAGMDLIKCEGGTDRAYRDEPDTVRDCETVMWEGPARAR